MKKQNDYLENITKNAYSPYDLESEEFKDYLKTYKEKQSLDVDAILDSAEEIIVEEGIAPLADKFFENLLKNRGENGN